jgi:hypothetical protein
MPNARAIDNKIHLWLGSPIKNKKRVKTNPKSCLHVLLKRMNSID